MSKPAKSNRVSARLPRGLIDRAAPDLRAQRAMLDRIREVYERYGFEPVETPAIEYTDALGKFLPDSDRPNEGVFSFQDDDEQWLSLRYDLTAPLARYVAENYEQLPKPYRSYREGYVFRNEKPGPGRYRQFMQFDADTVGSGSIAADAEMCMMMADCMEALGIARGDYAVRVNNRKVLDGVMEAIGLGGADKAGQRLIVLRAIDKLDRVGIDGVRQLLGEGRKDESGDFTRGARLTDEQSDTVIGYLEAGLQPDEAADGFRELAEIERLVEAAGYQDRVKVDCTVVRGLEYYTGPVFEAELLFETVNERGEKARFGSVGGGGRYDGLVSRFISQPVPATGFSIGVSRLQAALSALGKLDQAGARGPVVVTVMDRDRVADYQQMVAELRNAGIAAEMFLGNPKQFGKQLQYADRRGSPCVVIQGGDEHARGEITIKDLIEGARLAGEIEDNREWRESRQAQVSVPRDRLVAEVEAILKAHETGA